MTNESTDDPIDRPPNGEAAPSNATPSAARPRRLTRSRTDEWFGGVAGGLAEYFNTDPTLIRVVFVVATLLSSGFAILGYVAAWIIIPEAGDGDVVADGRPRTRRGSATAVIGGGVLIVGGTLLLLAQIDVEVPLPSLRVGLSAGLILVGLLIVFEARRGLHGGLITLAVILTLILGAGSLTRMDFRVDGAFGEQHYQVTRVEDLRDDYSHAFGAMTVDLRDLELRPGTTRIEASVAFGEVTIFVPEGIPYRLDGSSVFGSLDAPGFDAGGIASNRTYTTPGYAEAEVRFDIHLSAAFGTGRVRE